MCNLSQGILERGEARGEAIGKAKEGAKFIFNMYEKGYTLEQISDIADKDIQEIKNSSEPQFAPESYVSKFFENDYTTGKQNSTSRTLSPKGEVRIIKDKANKSFYSSEAKAMPKLTEKEGMTPIDRKCLEAGISRLELSRRSGVSARTLEAWGKRLRIPRDVYQLNKVAKALGCQKNQGGLSNGNHEKSGFAGFGADRRHPCWPWSRQLHCGGTKTEFWHHPN